MAKEKLRLDPETGEFVQVLTEEGQEIPDPRPMAPPVGFRRQEPLHMRIRAMVQHEFQRARAEREVETFEESEDFLVPDEDGIDPREARFAMMPGHEDEWEENYNPPEDFKEMKDRLVKAGWTPPKEGQQNSAVQPGKSDAPANSVDAPQAANNGPAGAKPA